MTKPQWTKTLDKIAVESGLVELLPKDESGALTAEASKALSEFYLATRATRLTLKNAAMRLVLNALPATRQELVQTLALPRPAIDFAINHLVACGMSEPGVRTDLGIVYHPRQPHTDAEPLWSVCGVTPAAVLRKMGASTSVTALRQTWGIGPASARKILKRMVAEDMLVERGFGANKEKIYVKKGSVK